MKSFTFTPKNYSVEELNSARKRLLLAECPGLEFVSAERNSSSLSIFEIAQCLELVPISSTVVDKEKHLDVEVCVQSGMVFWYLPEGIHLDADVASINSTILDQLDTPDTDYFYASLRVTWGNINDHAKFAYVNSVGIDRDGKVTIHYQRDVDPAHVEKTFFPSLTTNE